MRAVKEHIYRNKKDVVRVCFSFLITLIDVTFGIGLFIGAAIEASILKRGKDKTIAILCTVFMIAFAVFIKAYIPKSEWAFELNDLKLFIWNFLMG